MHIGRECVPAEESWAQRSLLRRGQCVDPWQTGIATTIATAAPVATSVTPRGDAIAAPVATDLSNAVITAPPTKDRRNVKRGSTLESGVPRTNVQAKNGARHEHPPDLGEGDDPPLPQTHH